MIKNFQKNKGFTMLVAIVVTSMLLIISYVVVNVAVKQLILANANEESQYAFYAADSGTECAVYWDLKDPLGSPFAEVPSQATITCNNQTVTPTRSTAGGITTNVFSIDLPKGCTTVTVIKSATDTTVNSRGYNTACGGLSLRKFERGVTMTFNSAAEVASPPPPSGPITYNVDYLIVAGGGGGGQSSVGFGILISGGGGAGGLLSGSINSLVQGTPYTVTVGSGGGPDADGGNSSIQSVGTAIGGGRGGAYNAWVPTPCAAGGSGGGASGYIGSGCAGTAGQGFVGGRAGVAGNTGGGGGGAGGPGQDGSDTVNGWPAAGGPGVASSISGSSVTYSVGGSTYAVQSLTPGSGGGGATAGNAGSGRSGIVIIRHSNTYASSCSGACSTTNSGGNITHTFTGPGTFTP